MRSQRRPQNMLNKFKFWRSFMKIRFFIPFLQLFIETAVNENSCWISSTQTAKFVARLYNIWTIFHVPNECRLQYPRIQGESVIQSHILVIFTRWFHQTSSRIENYHEKSHLENWISLNEPNHFYLCSHRDRLPSNPEQLVWAYVRRNECTEVIS